MTASLVLAVMVGSAVMALRWPRMAALVLALASVLWLLVNKQLEGPVLVSFTDDHGFTASDLLAVAGLGLAGVTLWRAGAGP